MLRALAPWMLGWVALCMPAQALACKCAAPPPVADALRDAASVFEGRVTKLTPLNSLELVVELNVVRSWKDADSEHILVRTRRDEAACGISFLVGDSYLVYATESPEEGPLPGLIALRCGRTRPIGEAEEDLGGLGVGVVPVSARKGDLPPDAPPASDNAAVARDKPAAGGCASCSALGADSAAAAALSGGLPLLFGVYFARRRRLNS